MEGKEGEAGADAEDVEAEEEGSGGKAEGGPLQLAVESAVAAVDNVGALGVWRVAS